MTAILLFTFLLVGQWPHDARFDVLLTLVGKETIHGRVLQANDQPAVEISVELVKASNYGNGVRLFEPEGKPVEVGPDGGYSFDVEPGEYYVRTVTPPGGPQARTYFPNTSNPGEAKPILVAQGDNVSADIHLSTTPVFKISGRIVDLLPDLENHYPTGVSLSSKSATVREYRLQSAFPGMPICCVVDRVPDSNVSVTLSNDRFEIRGVLPGTYRLTASIVVAKSKPDGGLVLLKKGEKPPYSARYRGQKTVEVTNADVEDVRVEVRHGTDLNGRIVSNGKGVNLNDNDKDIFMSGPDYDPNSLLFAPVDKSGRFSFPNLLDGTYALGPLPLLANAYVEDIRQGGRKLSGLEVTVNSANPESVEIILNPSPGQIDGQIFGSNSAVLVLVPMDDPKRYIPVPVRAVIQSEDFALRGLAPGQYRIFAFKADPSEVFRAVSISEFVRPYEAQGTPLVVKSGTRTNIRLSVIDLVGK